MSPFASESAAPTKPFVTVRPAGECRVTRYGGDIAVTYQRRVTCSCGYPESDHNWDGVDLAITHLYGHHEILAADWWEHAEITDPSGYRIDVAWCGCGGLGCRRCRVKTCDCGTAIPTRLRKCPSCGADARLAVPVRIAEPIPTTTTHSSK